MRRLLLVFLLMVFVIEPMLAQSKVLVPFYTLYETSKATDAVKTSSTRKDALVWADTSKQLRFFIHNSRTGELHIALHAFSAKTAKQLTLEVRGKKMTTTVPVQLTPKEIKIGTVTITDTGFIELVLSAKKLLPGGLGIGHLVLSGSAAEGLRFNAKPRLNAASVHLRYPLADTIKAISFYNEITVPKNADPLYTYYMATGFS